MNQELALRLGKALGWAYEYGVGGLIALRLPGQLPHNDKPLEYLLTSEGMLAILDAMRERGWRAVLEMYSISGYAASIFRFLDSGEEVRYGSLFADTLPAAVAEAALVALESQAVPA